MTWQRAPKRSMAVRNEMEIVEVIITANLLKVTILPPKSDTPHPRVVMVPLRILTPISEYACLIF